MKTALLTLLFLFSLGKIAAQQFYEVTPLSSTLSESSGLIYLNGKIVTHNDSQGEAALYEVDSITGNPTRKVVVANATNVDWEDITKDSNFIYIGDFGNNAGNRTNLKIYRVAILDYLNTPNDTVFADTIQFSYANQTDFTSMPQQTNFDCEAIASIGNSLYLFTKNWINAKTYVYALPKNPGTYSTPLLDSIFVQGLITGADYNPITNRLILCGYTQFPFIVEMNNPLGGAFGQNTFSRYNLSVPSLIQLEAISAYGDNQYYLTAESFQGVAVRLYRLTGTNGLAEIDELQKSDFTVFPNPSNGLFHLRLSNGINDADVQIYSLAGQRIPVSFVNNGSDWTVNEKVKAGVYLVYVSVEGKRECFKWVVE